MKRPRSLSKVIPASALTFLALVLNARWILGPNASTASANAVRTAVTYPAGTEAGGSRNRRNTNPFDPTLHLSRLELTESAQYQGTGRNIFSAAGLRRVHDHRPAPGPSSLTPIAGPASLQPRLQFFGFAIKPGGPRKIFLSQEGEVFVGSEGDIVNRRYRIVGIAPESVDVEDLWERTKYTLILPQP